jgi:hypothetical protein
MDTTTLLIIILLGVVLSGGAGMGDTAGADGDVIEPLLAHNSSPRPASERPGSEFLSDRREPITRSALVPARRTHSA